MTRSSRTYCILHKEMQWYTGDAYPDLHFVDAAFVGAVYEKDTFTFTLDDAETVVVSELVVKDVPGYELILGILLLDDNAFVVFKVFYEKVLALNEHTEINILQQALHEAKFQQCMFLLEKVKFLRETFAVLRNVVVEQTPHGFSEAQRSLLCRKAYASPNYMTAMCIPGNINVINGINKEYMRFFKRDALRSFLAFAFTDGKPTPHSLFRKRDGDSHLVTRVFQMLL